MKLKKLLAGFVSAAMIMGMTALPSLAEDNSEMTYGEFLKAVESSGYNYDGQGVVVTLKTNHGCSNDQHALENCPYGYPAATAETPVRFDVGTQYRAQYQPFKGYEGKISIKNVTIKADITDGAGWCANTGYKGEFNAGTDFYVELQFENKGDLTVENCNFDNICVAPYHNGGKNAKDVTYTDTITGCNFSNLYNTYGIATVNGGTAVISGNSFDNCSGGIYIQDGGTNGVTISKNSFVNMGKNALEGKKDYAGCIQLSEGMPSDAAVSIIDNTSDGSTPVMRQLSSITEVVASGNNFGGSDEITATDSSKKPVPSIKEPVAAIGDIYYKSLADAVKAAKDKDTIIIFGTVENAQNYLPADKTVTFKGADEKAVLKFSDAVALNQYAEKTLTFDGLTMEWPNKNYKGIQHSVNLVYRDVTVTGMPFLYAVNETFENCKFVQTDSNAYNVWTYGAENVVFKDCEFQSAGKSVLIYNEGTLINGKIDVQGCKFNASSPVEGKAAIEIDSTSSNYNLSIDSKTTATGFGTGSTSGNSLYNVKKYKIEKQADNTFKSNVTISVGGKEVTAVPLNAKVIDKIKTTGATIELKDLHKNDKINLADDATYELVVKTAPKADTEKANAAIKDAGDANSSKLILDVYVQKTDSNGNESKVDIRGQNVIYTIDETVAEDSAVNVYHVDADGNASKVENVKRDGQTIEFTADSFSTYAVTYTADSLTEAEISENVGVVFSKVEGTDNEYNIVLKALDGKKINRFMVARLAFKNACGTVDYEIAPAANMTASLESTNAQSREYRFNMDGTNASGATGDAITIGKIVFEGYGALDFSVDTSYAAAGAINVVETAKDADSIVASYSVADGTLAVNTDSAPEKGTITDTIELEKKTLTVNIDFNNRVEKNAAAYQNMKVTISGGDLAQDEIIALGEDNFTDDSEKTSYSVSKDLTVNTAYTVTVSGAGYRTARYTVTMTGDKVLNFWNNVKDNETKVEESNDASARKVTFLAGDIVKDNGINIYDLSAVVSYFGMKINKDTQPEYARYDLNRDGVIDSRDVAYVLVSWGK